jgi:ribosome-associated heat shock protein Hsp15
MNEPASTRIDKWLWAVRIFKTRSLATSACRDGQVTIGGQAVKPSRDVKVGDLIQAKTGEITRTIKVLKFLDRRVGAQVAKEYAEDLTPASEYEKAREPNFRPFNYRPKGSGRPTKKERRDIDRISGDASQNL